MVQIRHKKVTGRPVSIQDYDDAHLLTGTPGKTIVFNSNGEAAEADPAATPNLTNYYTKAQVDAAIAAAIDALEEGGGGTPAPAFTTQPSISPGSGTAGSTLFTASDGVASNTNTALTRRWLLGATQIGTGTTITPQAAGQLTLEVTAVGVGGTTIATSAAVTVAAAPGGPFTLPATIDNSLSAPTLTAGSGDTLLVGTDDTINVADNVTFAIEVSMNDPTHTSLTYYTNAIDAAEAAAKTASFGLPAIGAGTRRSRAYVIKGTGRSPGSNLLVQGADDQAPTLSLPTQGVIGATSATLGFTSDEAGTRYHVLVPQAEATPTALQVENGQRADGSAAVATATGAAIAGINSYSFSGATASTAYKTCTIVKDAAGLRSAVLTDTFSTVAASAFSITETAAGDVRNTYAEPSDFTNLSIGAAAPDRELYLGVVAWDGGTAQPTNVEVTIDGSILQATLVPNSSADRLSIWTVAAPTGTTASKISIIGEGWAHSGVKVWRKVGSGSPTATAKPGNGGAATVPATTVNGFGTIVFGYFAPNLIPTWTGGATTASNNAAGTDFSLGSASRTSASTTAIGVSNAAWNALSTVSFS